MIITQEKELVNAVISAQSTNSHSVPNVNKMSLFQPLFGQNEATRLSAVLMQQRQKLEVKIATQKPFHRTHSW